MCGADDKRPDTVDYKPSGVSPADVQPWLAGQHAGAVQGQGVSAEQLQCSDALHRPALTEPAPVMAALHFDSFVPRPSAATAPAHPLVAQEQANLQHAMLADMAAMASDHQLPEFTGQPAQMSQQPTVPNSVQELLQKGEQFVQHASASGIISDPGELARNFMRPKYSTASQTNFQYMENTIQGSRLFMEDRGSQQQSQGQQPPATPSDQPAHWKLPQQAATSAQTSASRPEQHTPTSSPVRSHHHIIMYLRALPCIENNALHLYVICRGYTMHP